MTDNAVQMRPPSAPLGLAEARMLLSGMLNAIVTSMVPMR